MTHLIESFKKLIKWGKIIFPLKKIRYYPPQFIIRDPVTQGVGMAFKKGYEVAIIVFNINNLKYIAALLGENQYELLIKNIKNNFKQVIMKQVPDEEVILLHDQYSDGLTLFLRVGHDFGCVSEIDGIMRSILEECEQKLHSDFPNIEIEFESGYMFVEKKHYSVQEAIYRAHQQALTMAEKRIQSEFNEMLYTISKIVSQRNITLLAQPIIDVQTREIKAWEMLTRGPKNTLYESPLHLFSVARQTGLLYELELIVLEKTLEQIQMTGCQHDIFINFTPISLGNQQFINDVRKIMDNYPQIHPAQLTIEITERDSLEGIEHLFSNIKVLRRSGFKIAVDDMGSGYASLNTISTIMPDIIKIDRSVIQDIDKNAVKESMLKGLLLVAKEADSLVVAEGIENAEEAHVLTRNNVDLAQGYFFAKPCVLRNSFALQ